MIYRSEHNDNFTRIDNKLVNDASLSLQAKGLMVIILSLPNDWSFSIGGLAHLTGLGRATIERLLAELKKHGYAKPEIKRDKLGKIISHDWSFYESAITSNCQIWREPALADATSGATQNLAEPEHGFLRCILTTNNNQLLNIPTTNINTKEAHGEFLNVMLTPEEYDKLEDKLGVETRDSLIFELSCYLKNHPKKYKDHYATILSWSRKRQKEKTAAAISSKDPFGDLLKQEGYQ